MHTQRAAILLLAVTLCGVSGFIPTDNSFGDKFNPFSNINGPENPKSEGGSDGGEKSGKQEAKSDFGISFRNSGRFGGDAFVSVDKHSSEAAMHTRTESADDNGVDFISVGSTGAKRSSEKESAAYTFGASKGEGINFADTFSSSSAKDDGLAKASNSILASTKDSFSALSKVYAHGGIGELYTHF